MICDGECDDLDCYVKENKRVRRAMAARKEKGMATKVKPKFLSVKYGRVSNLGNYETERIEVEVAVDAPHGEAEMFAALEQAKTTVNEVLGVEDDLTPEQIKRLQRSIERSKQRRGL